MNNLIVEPQCAPEMPRRKVWNFIPLVEFHSSSKAVQRIAIISSLMSDIRSHQRSRDTHTNAPPTTDRIPFLQIILPLSPIRHCFRWAALCPGA